MMQSDEQTEQQAAQARWLLEECERLRARISEIEHGDVLAEAGLLLVDVPEPGTEMAKVMRVNQILRKKRDDEIKRIAELERERDAAYKVVDENWVTHQRVVAADARITELELDLVRLRTLHDCERARAERLERAIRDAPHGQLCAVIGGYEYECNCWKRTALGDKP